MIIFCVCLGCIRSVTTFTPIIFPFLLYIYIFFLWLQVQVEVLKIMLDADCIHAPLPLPFNGAQISVQTDTTRAAHNQRSFDERNLATTPLA